MLSMIYIHDVMLFHLIRSWFFLQQRARMHPEENVLSKITQMQKYNFLLVYSHVHVESEAVELIAAGSGRKSNRS